MATVGFNALWLLCVILLLIAFFLAIRRRRLAARAEDRNNQLNATTFIRHTGQEVRIHMPSQRHPHNTPGTTTNNPTANTAYTPIHTDGIQPPPPTFDPHEDLPPPSYQDFNKDVRIQPSNNNNNNNNSDTNPP